jgi:hypothetical protein
MVAIASSSVDLVGNRAQQFVFGKWFGQILFRSDYASARAVEKPVLARQHDDWRVLKDLVVFDQRTGLVAIEARHHYVDENNVGLMIGNLGKRVETIDRRKHLASFFGK